MRKHGKHFFRLVARGMKVLPHTIFERLCFAYVQNVAVDVVHDVHARLGR